MRKFLTAVSLISIIFFNFTPVLAEDLLTPPPAPTAPPAPPPPPPPPQPTSPPPPSAPTLTPPSDPTPTDSPSPKVNQPSSAPTFTPTPTPTDTPITFNTVGPGGKSSGGNVGNTAIGTGDSTNSANTAVLANSNLSTNNNGTGGSAINNSGNGSGSTNNTAVNDSTTQNTSQDNNASLTHNLALGTSTGKNTSSGNVGDTAIVTGNANTSGTIISSANTNLAGVSVAEFNVADNHTGDIILNFKDSCISGCGVGSNAVINSGNGSGSTNASTVNNTNNSITTQTNNADVGNSLTLAADSGGNAANGNTGGSSTISSGDANVSGSVLSFLNNNIAGKVVLGVVNIFGNLIGDIILPENPSTPNSASAENTGNGSDSTNTTAINSNTTDQTFQNNVSNIQNDLVLGANTGSNSTGSNTGGGNTVSSGQANATSQTLNVANTNVDDGNIWLVLVNKSGQWVGQILGAPEGSNFAGSAGTQFSVSPSGEITAVNSGNGAGSQNTAVIDQAVNDSTTQSNSARLVNTVNLSANTGNNSASGNTGGDSAISTGDANVIANLVNFVNNNVSGRGKLIVTVVNVFGSWFGDFVTPGTQKQNNSSVVQNQTNSEPSEGNHGSGEQNGQSTTPTLNTLTATPPSSGVNQVLGDGVSQLNNVEQSFVEVAGFKTTADGQIGNQVQNTVSASRKIVINLAWFLLLLPLSLMSVRLIKRPLKIKQIKPKEN